MALIAYSYDNRASCNSYIDVATADTLNALSSYNSDWSAIDVTIKENLLIMATERLDFFGDSRGFVGSRTYTDGVLRFPRTSIPNNDGFEYSSTEIPNEAKKAVAELAMFIHSNNIYQADEDSNLQSMKVGDIAMTYKKSTDNINTLLNDRVYSLMKHFFSESHSSISMVR